MHPSASVTTETKMVKQSSIEFMQVSSKMTHLSMQAMVDLSLYH